jgi:hypothetical protein
LKSGNSADISADIATPEAIMVGLPRDLILISGCYKWTEEIRGVSPCWFTYRRQAIGLLSQLCTLRNKWGCTSIFTLFLCH